MAIANMGTTDRVIRLVAGLALILWFFMDGQSGGALHWLKGLAGLVLTISAALTFCPLYKVLGFSTR